METRRLYITEMLQKLKYPSAFGGSTEPSVYIHRIATKAGEESVIMTREHIIDDTIKYIKYLEGELDKLQDIRRILDVASSMKGC